MLAMYKQITIHTLHKQGEKKTKIAEQLGCHRNTVRNILGREQFIEQQTRVKTSRYTPYKTQIQQWIDQKISRLRMHELLHEQYGITEKYDTLCKYIQKQFPKPVEAFGVQEHVPGETM